MINEIGMRNCNDSATGKGMYLFILEGSIGASGGTPPQFLPISNTLGHSNNT